MRRAASVGMAAFLLAALPAAPALAWLYDEHRSIGEKGIETLDPRRHAALDRIWSAARGGYETRLCAETAVGTLDAAPKCIDLADWPAIAAYHQRLRQRPSIARALKEELALYQRELARHGAELPAAATGA